MEINYFGANCVEISTKQTTIITDSNLSPVGLKDRRTKGAIYVATQPAFLPGGANDGVIVEGPGEYEIGDFSIKGIPAQRMIDHDSKTGTTIYRIATIDVAIVVVGHVSAPLTDEQLEAIGVVDIAIVPVGGGGYTLDSHQAVSVVRQLDPKVVIPTHYADSAINYEVPQLDLEPFLKELSAVHETTQKYKIKNGLMPDTLTVMELSRS